MLRRGEIFCVVAVGKAFPKWKSYPMNAFCPFPFLSNCGHNGRQASALDDVQVGRCTYVSARGPTGPGDLSVPFKPDIPGSGDILKWMLEAWNYILFVF